jgi:lactate racemase
MKTISLPYGKSTLDVPVPDSVDLVTLLPVPMEPLSDARAEFVNAIQDPIGSPSLENVAKSAQGPVLIICTDQTRSDGKVQMITWLLDELAKVGIGADRVMVLMAFGSHTWLPDSAIAEILKPVSSRVKVTGHYTLDPMVDYGVTKAGTPVKVNARVANAGLVIMVSSVVHHYFAGYGGGRKMLVPGLASLETISANHSLIWEDRHDVTGGRHPMARTGILDGNPVHEDLMEAVGMVLKNKLNFSIVTVLSESKKFAYFAAGHVDSAHREAAKFADRHFNVKIDQPADVVLASAGGYPKDINLIQAHKGLDNAVHALKPGGTLLYVMECSEGPGNRAVEEFASMSLHGIRARLAGKYEVYGQTTHAMKTKTGAFRVVAVSGIEESLLSKLGFIPARGIDEALKLIETDLESAARVYVLPRSDITIPG